MKIGPETAFLIRKLAAQRRVEENQKRVSFPVAVRGNEMCGGNSVVGGG